MRKKLWFPWCLSCLAMLLSGCVMASDTFPLVAGARIRVVTTTSQTITGKVERLTADTIVVNGKSDLFLAPVNTIRYVEVAKVSRGKGAQWGSLIGMGIGGVTGMFNLGCSTRNNCSQVSSVGLMLGSATGAMYGAIIGALVKAEAWERVDFNSEGRRDVP